MSFPKYSNYEDASASGVNKKPEHWRALRLRFATNLNPSKQEAKGFGEQEIVTFLPMEAIGEDGTLHLGQEKEIGECLSGYTYFRDGDVCIAKITPCFENGKGAILRGLKSGIGFGTTELIVARPDEGVITSEFLDYLFRSQAFRMLGESEMYGAGGQKRVPDSFVRNFTALIPTLDEQNQITGFLNQETAKIDALIAEQESLIELLKEKQQAVISHAVTKGLNPDAQMKDSGVEWLGEVPEHWEVIPIKRLANMRGGFAFSSDLFSSTGIQLIRIGNLYQNQLDLARQPVFIDEKSKEDFKEFLISDGDILISLTGTLGKQDYGYAIIAEGIGDLFLNQRVGSLRKKNGSIDEKFLLYSMRSDSSLAALYSKPSGTKQANLSNSDVLSIKVAIPKDIAEQQEIVEHIEREIAKVEKLVEHSNCLISLLSERRSALISAAVTGQIDVRGLGSEQEVAA